MLKIHHAPLDFRESEHTMKSVAMAYIQSGYYDKAVPWVERQDSLFAIASNRSDRDTIYIDEMKADLSYCKMLLAHKRGASYEADDAYRDYLSTRTSKRLGHIINSTEYLMQTKRYSEAAAHYEQLQRYMDASAFEVDLENIGRYLFPKYRANLLAGRKDTALSVATQIAEAYDSALAQQKRSDAVLLATVYDTEGKERQIAEQRAELSHQRLISTAAVLLLIVIFFTVYIISRRRAYNKLDASNRKLVLANERAEESSRMKTQFIQQISHEVRTPLNILTGFTQVLADPEIKLDDEELQSISKKMVENSDRITNLVNKMIELSETKSNADIECNDEVLALQIASEAVSASGVDEAGHLTFSMIVSPEVEQVSVHTNLRAAVRALSLVLDNARKFTAPAETRQHEQLTNHLQRVVLRISISSGRLFFSVEDTGIGIPHKEAERIFDEFVQLDEFYEGTGIGLAVARSLARRLGGDIVLDTAYIGGSRFVLTLPV
jgi:signal transduction histidine kinase